MYQLDIFINYLTLIEESTSYLTTDQIKKLELIKTKVTNIITTINSINLVNDVLEDTQKNTIPNRKQLSIFENKVDRFSTFSMINEKVIKRKDKWLVTTKDGSKILGTHSTKEKAIKQLQAIEISKAKYGK